jgi:CRISPR-associated endonuclease/helicase Cas3
MTAFSHPGKPLVYHLNEVAQSCKRIMSERHWLQNSPVSQEIMRDVAYLCGSFHDLGKATTFFQHYLLSEKHEVLGPKNHALISSLFVREVVKAYLSKTELEPWIQELISTFAYTATRRHHGGLNNLEDEVELAEKSKELEEIIDAFLDVNAQEIISFFLPDVNLTYDFQVFKGYIKSKKYVNELFDFYDDELKHGDYEDIVFSQKIQFFYLHQLLYSTLLFSDKTDVIVGVSVESSSKFPPDGVEQYRRSKGFNQVRNSLDESKNKAYYDSIKNLVNVYEPNQHIYSLTLPTGLGKTLTSLGVALKLKELNPNLKRLIITIPFTSIIDQNYDVYKEVAQTDDSSVILKHHHQAEPSYKMGDDELSPDISQFLIETWQSEVVVTTFVQLLNSIFSNDKSLLMKLPNLANSIIILDEIQTINFEHWQLINQVFKELGQLLNCYFILMSATQPLIFLPDSEIKEIVPDYKSYFKLFNRTKIINKATSPISQDDFVSEVIEYAVQNPRKDLLLILNTKASCLQVFEKMKEILDLDTCNLYYMSTLITPYERKRIIGFLKKKKSDKQQIVVTTQLIEAGVDISVDTVFRVLAPIDAIIQASGRANRYNEKGYACDVFLYEIEESMKGSQRVYGSALLLKSKNVLNEIREIEENDYLRLINAYFKEVRKQSDSLLVKNLEHIGNLAFKDLGEFSLIEERFTESVFVQVNQTAKQVWEQFKQIYLNQELNIFQKRLEFGKLKSKFYDYVVNVPVPHGEKEIAFDSPKEFGFRLVKLGIPSGYYPYSDTDLLQNIGYKEVKVFVS